MIAAFLQSPHFAQKDEQRRLIPRRLRRILKRERNCARRMFDFT
jgi:hypothetical protein